MSGERVVSRESLFLATHGTPDLVLAIVMDSVLVTRKIVGPREDSVTGLIR